GSEGDDLSSLFRNPIGRPPEELALMRRRTAILETVSAGSSLFTGVFFGMLFVAESSRLVSLAWGTAVGLLAAGLFWELRRRRPAEVSEAQLLTRAGPSVEDQ